MRTPTLLRQLSEDWRAHGRPFPLASAGFQVVALHRLGRWAARRPEPWRSLLCLAHRVAATVARNLYGIELPLDADVGRRLWVAHQGGIVVAHGVVIGDDCIIRQNVTIGGQRGRGRARIGDRVEIGAGAVIIGGVRIGDDATVGPNTTVLTDVPRAGFVFSAPSRVVAPISGPGSVTPPESDGDLREFLCLLQSAVALDCPIGPDDPLVSSGLLDSFDLVTVVAAIEQRYGVQIPADAIGAERFDTPRQMHEMSLGRRASST